MKRILIFSGTTEGRQLADILDASGICADVCVATGYGHEVMTEGQYRNIYTGRLTEEEMKEFMQKGDYAAIVDATHPYAVVVSSNIRQASAQAGLPYYRLRRTLQSAGDDSDVIYVKSQQECVRALEQTSGNILLTTGSKELHCYCENETLRERLFVRVLPGTESIEICHKNGILGRQIIAMQGPFSEEMNLALLHQYQIRYMVTKESGASGGFSEKISAAKKAGVSVFVIENPEAENGEQKENLEEILQEIERLTGKHIRRKQMQVSLVGIGMGNTKLITEEAAERADIALQEGDALQDRVLVLYDAEIHESIAGIVAGRIKDKYYRPTILITGSEDGAKGSGRSIEGYHLFEALFADRDLFTRFGGHAMAAGLSLPVENIPVLRRRLNEGCTLTEEQMIPILRLEDALSFAEIDLGLAKELQTLAPFGKGNPAPLFASKGIHADRVDLIGKNKDILRLTLSEPENGIRLSAISFDGYEPLREMLKALYPAEDCDKIINSGLLPQLLDIV